MASELKPHTPTPWIASVDYVCYMPPGDPGALATPIADFQHPYDAAYAVKAVNMHERLVEAIRLTMTHAYAVCWCDDDDDMCPHCELAAILKEAADE